MECEIAFRGSCTTLETTREDIASANKEAANARGKVLLAQKSINIAEYHLPRTRETLWAHNKECTDRLLYLNNDLTMVLHDIGVMTNVLQMTECDQPTAFLQDPKSLACCKRKSRDSVKKKLALLHSSAVQKLAEKSLMDLVEGEEQPAASD